MADKNYGIATVVADADEHEDHDATVNQTTGHHSGEGKVVFEVSFSEAARNVTT